MLTVLPFAGCHSGAKKNSSAEAVSMINAASESKDYKRVQSLADSLGKAGKISDGESNYWQGYACYQMGQRELAKSYWQEAIKVTENSTDANDLLYYAKSASYLTSQLCRYAEYAAALYTALPVINRLEKIKCDTTSDFMNLLIYIGCCHMGIGSANKETADHFNLAYQKHLANIEQNHDDESYKDAIAGLINIAYACITTKNYEQALKWTDRFGKLLGEYEQRPGINESYIDKQLARFYIYKAIAHECLGQQEEASKIYASFLKTEFSKTPEGHINANEYLMAANRWDEAADNYRSLDAMFAGEDAYTIENIKAYALKKYKTNLLAGRRDSALAVSRQICDSLEHAFNLAKKLDAEEQIVIIDKIEQLTQQDAANARQKQLGLFALLGLLFLCFIGYAIYRGHKIRKLHAAHKELKADYGELETRTADKERTQTELRTALEAQKALLPAPLPNRKDLTVLASLTSGQGLSSDLYDYLIRNEKLIFCIGSAHGSTVQSSVQMAMAWSQFRTAAAISTSPAQILSAINNSMAATNGKSPAIDLFVGVLDIATGLFTYSLAGNFSPLLLQNEEVSLLPVEATSPAGAAADTSYKAFQTEIAPGTMLFIYTNGVINITNANGKTFGEKRLRGSVLQALKMHVKPAPFIEGLSATLREFAGSATPETDQTMLLVSRN